MIFQIKDGVEKLVGEVNKINTLSSGGEKIKEVVGTSGRRGLFVLNGTNLAWNDGVSFPGGAGDPVSISEKFDQLDGRFDELISLEGDVQTLISNVSQNEGTIAQIYAKLNSQSNFLEVVEVEDATAEKPAGIHSNLSLNYDNTTGKLSLLGNATTDEDDGVNVINNKVVVAQEDLVLASAIEYSRVHTYNGNGEWTPAIPEKYGQVLGNSVNEGAPHIVIAYKQAGANSLYTVTTACLKDLIDVYYPGDGLQWDTQAPDSNTFKVKPGDGVVVSPLDGIEVDIDKSTGLQFNSEGQVSWQLQNFESIHEIPNNLPNGTMVCILEEETGSNELEDPPSPIG